MLSLTASESYMSNPKKTPGCLVYIGDYTTSDIGIIINLYKDPIKQPV